MATGNKLSNFDGLTGLNWENFTAGVFLSEILLFFSGDAFFCFSIETKTKQKSWTEMESRFQGFTTG